MLYKFFITFASLIDTEANIVIMVILAIFSKALKLVILKILLRWHDVRKKNRNGVIKRTENEKDINSLKSMDIV